VTVKADQDIAHPAPNRLDRVLASQSQFVRVPTDFSGNPTLPTQAPPATVGRASGGTDSQYLQPTTYIGDENSKTGLYLLQKTDLFNLLCIPPDLRDPAADTDPSVYQEALEFCVKRRAMLIVDPPSAWLGKYKQGELADIDPSSLYLVGDPARNAAVYFPEC